MEIQTDEDGFLLDPDDWNEDIALQIAKSEEIELTEESWNLVRMIRNSKAAKRRIRARKSNP
jgi:tRNA 2-thiouridine synthesizing protein E